MQHVPKRPKRRFGLLLATLVAFVAASTMFGASAHADRKCANRFVYGTSPAGPIPWTTKSAARTAAINNWTGSANLFLPNIHGDWAKARKRKVVCNRVPNGFGGFNHACEVKAIPCWDTLD